MNREKETQTHAQTEQFRRMSLRCISAINIMTMTAENVHTHTHEHTLVYYINAVQESVYGTIDYHLYEELPGVTDDKGMLYAKKSKSCNQLLSSRHLVPSDLKA